MKRFAGFIITHNRNDVLSQSIDTVLQQTYPPEILLIVDNSDSGIAKQVVDKHESNKLHYHGMGYNAGPAGAAYFALTWFAKKEFEWVYWGDDDDPPKIPNTFEIIFKKIIEDNGAIGIAAAVGQKFNKSTGIVVRLKDSELEGLIEVDSIAGGLSMIINMKAVKNGVLPNPSLFFGFEELDFCLKMKAKGYKLFVNGELMYNYRLISNRLGYSRSKIPIGKPKINREYYSVRNLIFILLSQNPRLLKAAVLRTLTLSVKALVYIILNPHSGFKYAKIMYRALKDGWSGNLGYSIGTTA